MKLVILGGSSASTPVLFQCLAAYPHLPALEIFLVGRSPSHLKGVAHAAGSLLGDAPILIFTSGFVPSELVATLSGADLVLVQVRFGGYEGREFDEAFPLQYGMCGDEGLGPGGLSGAWRAWPALQDLLYTIKTVCPAATILMLSSPIGILMGAIRSMFPKLRVYGICELPWTTLVDFAAKFDAQIMKVDADYFGINHMGWFYRVECEGCDLLAEYKSGCLANQGWPSPALVARCGGLPTKYLRMHYNRDEMFREQKERKVSRAEVLRGLSADAYETFRAGSKASIVRLLERRPAPWYEHAVVPFILSAAGMPSTIPYFLTGLPSPTAFHLEQEDLLELPAMFHGSRLCVRTALTEPPDQILDVVRAFLAYERRAIAAVVSRDTRQLEKALSIHPWVSEPALAIPLTRDIAGQQASEGFFR